MFLSCSHFVVRVLGFIMRIWLSRELGAAAMGLVELSHSAQMLLLTPVISGLPAAVSRMSAKADGNRQVCVLRCGIVLALLTGIPLAIGAFVFRNAIAQWLGDMRTLPALILYLPCIPILGVSCALNGYFYGTGHPVPPTLGELLEQIVRFFLSMRLCALLRGIPLSFRAAIPALGALAGETVSLIFMLVLCLGVLFGQRGRGEHRAIFSEMIALALPLTGMRLVSSFMRTVNAMLVPARLETSGLPQSEALSLLGIKDGMLMPLLMLPSFITCSLCMVSAPELTRRQARGLPMRRLCLRVASAALAVGFAAMAGLWLLAPLVANTLYRQADLLPYLRRCSLLIPVLSLSQVVGGMMNGLGLQGAALRVSLISSFVNIVLTYALAVQPALRLWGVLLAMAIAQVLALVMSIHTLRRGVNDPADTAQ